MRNLSFAISQKANPQLLTHEQEQVLKSLNDRVDQHNQNIATLVSVINKLSNAVDEGFNDVYQRLSRLEVQKE